MTNRGFRIIFGIFVYSVKYTDLNQFSSNQQCGKDAQ